MTLLIEALSGVLDTFLLYLFASGFYSKYRSTKYKGHLYLLVGIFIIVMSCIPMPGILRILLSWSIISVSTYAIFESTVRKALLTSTAFITLSVLVDVICEYPFYLSGISRTIILGQGLACCSFFLLSHCSAKKVYLIFHSKNCSHSRPASSSVYLSALYHWNWSEPYRTFF